MGRSSVEDAQSTASGDSVTSDDIGPTRLRVLEPSSWDRRPKLAAALRTAIALVPTIASFLITFLIARYLPPSAFGFHTALWWLGLVSCGFATLLIVDRTLRQLLPLVALLRLSLIFPDQAPSRFSIAMRTGTTRQLQRRIDEVRRRGLSDDHQEQAEHLLELVASLSKHDRMTRGHCERVRAYTDLLAEEMGLDEDATSHLRWAALAHDVGKIFVPAEILNSHDAPTGDDWDAIKSHTWLGEELVEPLRPWLGEWLDAVGQHHERWDGDGYPNRLSREQIHRGARIVAVADAFDVMTSRRSYKKPMSAKLARAEIADRSGEQFDPEVARALMNISIGRLRFAIGPATWLFNIPSASSAALTPLAAPAFTTATAATTTMAAAFVGHVITPDPPLALADPTAIVAEDALQFFPTDDDPTEQATVTTLGPAAPATSSTTAPPAPPPTSRATAPTTAINPTVTTTNAPSPTTSAQPSTTQRPTTTATPTTATPTTAPPTTGATTTPPPKPANNDITYALDVVPDVVVEDGRAVFIITVASPHDPIVARVTSPPSMGSLDITSLRAPAQLQLGAPGVAGPVEGTTTATETFSIAYTPTADRSGVDTMSVEFCDSANACVTSILEVDVVPTPDAPVIEAPAAPFTIVRNTNVELTIAASDPDGDGLSYAATGLPNGLTINPETGVITGTTSAEVGTGSFAVTVTDDAETPTSAERSFDFTITDPPPPPPPPEPDPFDQRLIISAARHHSSPGDALIDEFVEITNVSTETIDLSGVTLRDFAEGTARDRAVKWDTDVDTSFVFTFPSTDREHAPSMLAPGATARIWISEPCGTTFTVGDQTVQTQGFRHTGQAALTFVIDEATWHRLDLAADDLWLHTADGALEDFVRWRADSGTGATTPTWWQVPLHQEQRWANSGAGNVVWFNHDRSHRTN